MTTGMVQRRYGRGGGSILNVSRFGIAPPTISTLSVAPKLLKKVATVRGLLPQPGGFPSPRRDRPKERSVTATPPSQEPGPRTLAAARTACPEACPGGTAMLAGRLWLHDHRSILRPRHRLLRKPGGFEEVVANELLPLGVIPELTEVERHARLAPGDLGVMARWNREHVAWA